MLGSQEELYKVKRFLFCLIWLFICFFLLESEIKSLFSLSEEIVNKIKFCMNTIVVIYIIVFNLILLYNRKLEREYIFKINFYVQDYIKIFMIDTIKLEKKSNVIIDKQKLDFLIYFLEKYKEISINNNDYAKQIFYTIVKIHKEHLLQNKCKDYNNEFLKYFLEDLSWFIHFYETKPNKIQDEKFLEGIYTKYKCSVVKEKSLMEQILI